MKPLYVALFPVAVFAPCIPSQAQQPARAAVQDTSYFSYADQPTIPQLATYYQTMVHTDSGWTFTQHWVNDRLKATGRISDDLKHRLGTYNYYDTAGNIVIRRKYVGHGGTIETRFYPNGHVMIEGTALDEQRTGDWTAYYPSGDVKAKGFYVNGQVDTASFFNEDGSANTTRTIFWRESDYPGGSPAFLHFLNKNLHYPDDAVNNGVQGTVVVGFKVSEAGTTSNFTVAKSAGKSLDNEAIRVIRLSGDWLPGLCGGTPIETYKIQPIVFRYEGVIDVLSGDDDYDKTYTKVEIESEFPGGSQAWLRFLKNNLKYPREAWRKDIQGMVEVQFIVDLQGNVSDVRAVGGPEVGGLREEAVRLIKNSGKWTPAVQNGHGVKAYKKQSIVFELDR